MSNDPPLAHSPRKGRRAQTYVEHVTNVRSDAVGNAKRAVAFRASDREAFVGWVDAAALYHDLGKLDEVNQAVLRGRSRKPLAIVHEDAGVAELDRLRWQESVALVAAHHAGLFSRSEDVLAAQGRPFRELRRKTPAGLLVADHVDSDGRLDEYRNLHRLAGCPELLECQPIALQQCGLTRRLALSCLVDADHGDTARHYGREVETPEIETRWNERAVALQRYVDRLPKGTKQREHQRNELRQQLFEACRAAPTKPAIRACDAPVGSGKTTAVMAHLLRVAAERKPALRHIFVVLPYTNIITQSVDVYRKALVLEGERPEDVVAEHHHRADFENLELRQLATLWKAPIIVTTAVQFFETLGSHHPARLRKLHELPGSAVFVDEMHAAIPSHLWPQVWRWLETWTRDWGGHLVLASGSLPRFWELDEYREMIRAGSEQPMPPVPDLVESTALTDELRRAEGERVRVERRIRNAAQKEGDRDELEPALNLENLVQFVSRKPGPRLLVVNTVQTAAVVAQAMRDAGHDVLHLSTALAPAHRDLVVQRVRLRLRDKIEDWTLVATSCVESGMDFSFRTGFRESASTASLIQVGGRVNRGGEHEDQAEVWDLQLNDYLFRSNPALEVPRRALDRISKHQLNQLSTTCLTTTAMQQEWTAGAEAVARMLIDDEDTMEYRPYAPGVGSPIRRGVGHLCRVIPQQMATVIVDAGLAEAVRKRKKVSPTELLLYSVQMWPGRITDLGLEELHGDRRETGLGLYALGDLEYQPEFLGYMAGVLRNQRLLKHEDPDAWVV